MAAAQHIDSRLDRFRERVVGRSISEATFEDYQRWIRRFEAWAEQANVSDPDIAALEDWDNYLADGSRTDYPWDEGQGRPSPDSYSYRSRINAASAAKLWLRREYGTRIPETPGDICLGEPDPFDPTYLSPEDVDRILRQAPEACSLDGCAAALMLSYDLILRASELVRVRREDINFDSGTVYVRASKGSQNAEVGIDRRTADALQARIEDNPSRDLLFENSYGRPWTASAWASHVKRCHADVGSHAVGRHAPVMNRLEGANPPFLLGDFTDEDFGSVYRRARHRNPSQTAEYARVVGVDVPEWSGESG